MTTSKRGFPLGDRRTKWEILWELQYCDWQFDSLVCWRREQWPHASFSEKATLFVNINKRGSYSINVLPRVVMVKDLNHHPAFKEFHKQINVPQKCQPTRENAVKTWLRISVIIGWMCPSAEKMDWIRIAESDSACSSHYTAHREWFSTKQGGGSFRLGHHCCVEGVGTIQVQMFDTSSDVWWSEPSTNVKHVPSLKKNLISLGWGVGRIQLWSKSRQQQGGSLVVIKGVRMANNRMIGKVVKGKHSACAADEQQVYRLWHFRMGHMSQAGLRGGAE